MSTGTLNYSFLKPDPTEFVNVVAQLNDNWDDVDTELFRVDGVAAVAAKGLLADPVQGTGNVAFAGETLIDSITFVHTLNRYERVNFSSFFSLNAGGVATTRFRYVAGTGPVTTGGTLVYESFPTGSTTNNHMCHAKILNATFRALASGTYTIGAFILAQSGAASGTAGGTAAGISRDFSVEDLGAV